MAEKYEQSILLRLISQRIEMYIKGQELINALFHQIHKDVPIE